MNNLFRAIPSNEACLSAILQELSSQKITYSIPRPLCLELITEFLDQLRAELHQGKIYSAEELSLQAIFPALSKFVQQKLVPKLRKVINGTGVVVHTNMGRSILAEEAQQAILNSCSGYNNLELDLNTGQRGSRYNIISELLCKITGAEAALVVNNNAAAVFLCLNSLCAGKEVIISRGQLVEIGGSFRIPEIMTKSNSILHEVGTTNRTHLHDYTNAINENSAALMRVHTSNYRIIGFHTEVPLPELVQLGQQHNLIVIDDLGSGSLLDLSAWGLTKEPTVQSIVADGADVVMFSGDKVLGGPQAGIIVGKKSIIEKIRANPLTRALRIDKLIMAALEATLRLYLEPELALKKIPTLNMLTTTAQILHKKAIQLKKYLKRHLGADLSIDLIKDYSCVGGGSFPEVKLETTLLCLKYQNKSAVTLRDLLLKTVPPVIGRMENKCFCLDVRTINNAEYTLLVNALKQALDI